MPNFHSVNRPFFQEAFHNVIRNLGIECVGGDVHHTCNALPSKKFGNQRGRMMELMLGDLENYPDHRRLQPQIDDWYCAYEHTGWDHELNQLLCDAIGKCIMMVPKTKRGFIWFTPKATPDPSIVFVSYTQGQMDGTSLYGKMTQPTQELTVSEFNGMVDDEMQRLAQEIIPSSDRSSIAQNVETSDRFIDIDEAIKIDCYIRQVEDVRKKFIEFCSTMKVSMPESTDAVKSIIAGKDLPNQRKTLELLQRESGNDADTQRQLFGLGKDIEQKTRAVTDIIENIKGDVFLQSELYFILSGTMQFLGNIEVGVKVQIDAELAYAERLSEYKCDALLQLNEQILGISNDVKDYIRDLKYVIAIVESPQVV